jgi:hypothetical protein
MKFSNGITYKLFGYTEDAIDPNQSQFIEQL